MRRLPITLIAAALLAGCVFRSSGSGDITLRWSFPGGATCAQTPSAAFIHITLSGPNGPEALDAGGWYKCDVAGSDGIVLQDFSPGTYSYEIDAYDGPSVSNTETFAASGTVRVNGNTEADVQLSAVAPTQPGDASFVWTFPGGATCAQTPGAADLLLTITGPSGAVALDNGGWFACATSGVAGTVIKGLPGGSYSYTLDAYGAASLTANHSFTASGTFAVDGNVQVAVALVSAEVAGNITLRWSFPGGATCAQTPSASYIHVTVTGPNGPETLDSGGWFRCTVAGQDGIVLLSFNPGDYSYTLDAYDGPDAAATRHFTGTGTLHVNGDVEADVALTAI